MVEMNRGDLILSREKTLFSWLVRKVTKSEWSHVGIYLGTIVHVVERSIPMERWQIVDSEEEAQSVLNTAIRNNAHDYLIMRDQYISAVPFKGVSLSSVLGINTKVVYRVKEATSLQCYDVASFCLSKIGCSYDYLQGLLLGYRIFTDKIDKYAGDPNPDEYVCSELVSEAWDSVGVRFGKIVDNVLPKQLAESNLVERVS